MVKSRLIISLILGLVLVLGLILTGSSCAPAAPEGGVPKRINWVVPSSPGGTLDTITRAIAPYFEKHIGSSLVIENRPGADNILGLNYVYQQPPDGRYLVVSCPPQVTQQLLHPDAPVFNKPITDAFVFFGGYLNEGGNVMIAAKGSPMTTLEQVVAEAKKRTLKVAVGQIGSTDAISAMIINRVFNIQLSLVPYTGGGEAPAAVMGGHVDLAIVGDDNAALNEESFNLIATTSPTRLQRFPNMPTFDELGHPEVVVLLQLGGGMREGTPQELVNQYEAALEKAFKDPAFQALVKERGWTLGQWNSAKMFTDSMTNWKSQMEFILPDLQKAMAEQK